MKIISTLKGIKKIGLAYSGGLDTSAVIKWVSSLGIKVFAFYADLGQSNKDGIKKLKNNAINYGASKFFSIDCKLDLIREGFIALKSRAFNFITGCTKYYNTTPLGRIVTSVSLTKKMINSGIKIWCDGSTYKGNDIERFFRYSCILNQNLNYYKPWLDSKFINKFGGRKQMSEFVGLNDTKNKYSIDSNILGNTYEGCGIESLTFDLSGIDFIYCGDIKSIPLRSKVIKFSFVKGDILMVNNSFISLYCLFKYLNKLCGSYNLGISDQIEERITSIKSRGIYESPTMHLLHNVYDRAISCIYKNDTIKYYNISGLNLAERLYEGKWFEDLCHLIKLNGVYLCNRINGVIKVKITPSSCIIFLKTQLSESIYIKDLVSMERTVVGFKGKDRVGCLNVVFNSIQSIKNRMKKRML
ncbi:argininosuccinate synthase [Candidatus Vidania fulgoroideorum]